MPPPSPEPVPSRDNPVRVLLFTTVYPHPAQPFHGIFVRRRMLGLPDGFAVRVVAPRPWFPGVAALRPGFRPPAPAHEVQDGVEVHHPRFLSFPGFWKCLDGLLLLLSAVPTLVCLRRRFRFELIDAHFGYPEGPAAMLLGRLFRVPVVLTLRGMETRLAAAFRLRRWQMGWAVRKADRVIAVSRPLADTAAALGRPRGRVRVIPNGVDAGHFRPIPREEARRALGLREDGRYLLSVGTLTERKGIDLAIDALAQLAGRFPDLRYLVVGGAGAEGSRGAELARRAERCGVGERVIFAGPKDREELPLWYSAADLFVLASSHEGCPNVVLEALACGTPVVATPVGEVPWLLADPAAGVVLPERSVGALAAAVAAALERSWDREAVRAVAASRTWRVAGAEAGRELAAALGRLPERAADPADAITAMEALP